MVAKTYTDLGAMLSVEAVRILGYLNEGGMLCITDNNTTQAVISKGTDNFPVKLHKDTLKILLMNMLLMKVTVAGVSVGVDSYTLSVKGVMLLPFIPAYKVMEAMQ